MTPELRDTFRAWKLDAGLRITWLSERAFADLDRRVRVELVRQQIEHGRGAVPAVRRWTDLIDQEDLRAQADGHRFVWWPSLLRANTATILERVVAEGREHSRNSEVKEDSWERCLSVLPLARRLAGTLPGGSGPNCFSTVMAACGQPVADEWILQKTFERWLAESTSSGGDDHRPGTILVWRDRDGSAQHAAVTIGDGWALEKPSQEWHSARVVLEVRDLIKANRTRGQRLERHRFVSGP